MAGSASGLVERFMNLFVQVWLYQYLIKRISPDEYSLYPVVTALLIFVGPLLMILTAGVSRDTMEAHARNDDERITQLTSTMLPLLLGTAICLVLLTVVVTIYLDSIIKVRPQDLREGRAMVVLLLGSLALRVGLIPFGAGLFVRQKFVLINSLNVAQTLVRVALLFVLLIAGGPRVIWVVVASVVADLGTLLVSTVLSVRELPALKFRFASIRWNLLPALMTFGFWNMIANIGIMIRKSSDLLILNRFATPIDVDTFHLASLTDSQIDAAGAKLIEPLTPHLVTQYAKGGVAALHRSFAGASRYLMWACLLVATILIAFRQEIWSLYLGSKLATFPDVPAVMVLLLVRYWIECPIWVAGQTSYAIGRVREVSLIVIATSIFNVGITIYFVRNLHMGAIGSALGTLIAVIIWSLFVLWAYSLHMLQMKFTFWFRETIWPGMVPSVVAGIFAFGWHSWMQPKTLPDLLLAAALVMSVYLACIVLFFLDETESRQLKQLWAKFSPQRV
jgi:O-antigen/teichoic acid export membrane protein